MDYKELGKYIREQRVKSGKSLNSFAIDIGIEPAILSRIENLKQNIKLNVLVKIASGFGKTPAVLLAEFEKES